jgi:hypothetical protein
MIASVRLAARLRDGAEHIVEIEAAEGSRDNPLSDRQLDQKLRNAAARAGWTGNPDQLLEALWRIEEIEDVGAIIRLAAGR